MNGIIFALINFIKTEKIRRNNIKKQCNIFLLAILSFFLLLGSSVYALSIDIYDSTDQSSIDNWIDNHGGNVIVLENFDSFNDGWYHELNSDLGLFEANGEPGTGQSSYTGVTGNSTTEPYFRILDGGTHGRNGSPYLDSADITKIDLTIDSKWELTNLFFYIMDPSDVNASTTISSVALDYLSQSQSLADSTIANQQANGSQFFVGISANTLEGFINAVNWSTNSDTNDGYGLDDFSTVASVPEPTTMLLFGLGLIGLAGFGRKKIE